jgi:hypothetical protein
MACGALLLVGCMPMLPAGAVPPTPRVGYERLQHAYSVWQLLDRARESTARLQSWREWDVDTGSWWEYVSPNRSHYRFVGSDGQVHEAYESDEMACWRRDNGKWDRRAISRRPPAAPALADDLFSGAVQVIPEQQTELDGVPVQVVRYLQRAGERRWSTLASDREVRVWIGLDDALPRRVEIARPNFRNAEYRAVRVLSDFDEPMAIEPPCR